MAQQNTWQLAILGNKHWPDIYTKKKYEGPIFPSVAQAKLKSSLLYGSHGLNLVILNLLALMIESTLLMTISMEMVCMAKSQPSKNQSEHLHLPQDFLAIE